MPRMKKMICLVDGEHYLPVTKAAIDLLDSIEHVDVVSIVFIGGTEKLRSGSEEEYEELMGRPVYFGSHPDEIPYQLIGEMMDKYQPDAVMDLSDEPVLDYSQRFKIASLVLGRGINYEGPDFKFEPLTEYDVLKKPSLKILGTGKRIGKTAVSAYAARVINKKYNPCVVAMGRGGPENPEIVKGHEIEITPHYLIGQSDKGVHAASDHWEGALMSRILTIGCRRCGGGMGGDVFITNMKKGAELANNVDANFLIMEGSGAAIPPIKTDKEIVLVGVNQPLMNIENFLGPFRISLADIVILTMCEEPMADEEKINYVIDLVKDINPQAKIIPTVFRPKPLGDIANKNVLFATTAPEFVKKVLVDHLEQEYGCKVIGTTPHLSNRTLLHDDIDKYISKVDVMLTELKAAAVDVATKEALDEGLEVVYCDNIPMVISEEYGNLSEAILELVEEAIEDHNS